MSRFQMTPPDMPQGTFQQQVTKLYSYLYRMHEALTVALDQVDNRIDTVNGTQTGADGQQKPSDPVQKAISGEAENLRSLIIKSANEIELEMDELVQSLASTYVAQSDFGTFRQNLQNTIRQTAQSTIAEYGLEESIDALEDANASFSQFRALSNQYIKFGLLYYDDNIPRYGVAVGENMTTIIVDGREVINRQNLCATFTSDRLSFWQNDTEVAYLSNSVLHIGSARVDEMTIHEKWKVYQDADGGICIEWIGGVPTGVIWWH